MKIIYKCLKTKLNKLSQIIKRTLHTHTREGMRLNRAVKPIVKRRYGRTNRANGKSGRETKQILLNYQ
jgi:hypothetical protein